MYVMEPGKSRMSYPELVEIGEYLLDGAGEDDDALVRRIEVLPLETRNELLVLDVLSAWQVFYYFFRLEPDELVRERLELEPASVLLDGVLINEIELLEMYFLVKQNRPVIVISDGGQALKTFSGRSAYEDGLAYVESML